ncbi:hypothetical protein OIE68_35065 [Nocardia vinacea]|uniref:Uncharacterized protein n=1 Tax=Nocardia vinacea TaxID=96468 RepID=A0ABZ1Z4X3_9NOCA|nr:hypothetical protein OIE68_35065 [Nocardia vinacea]
MGDDQHDEDSPNSSRPQQEVPPERRSWVSRHPVLAAMLLPVIPGLIVGLIILVPDKAFDAKQDGISSAQSPTPAQQASRTEPADRPTTVSAPATSPTSTSSEDVRWSGTVNLTYLDLDSVPPRVVSGNNGASTWASYNYSSSKKFSEATLYGLRGDFLTVEPTIASWTNPTKPTRQQCADLIVTQGVESLPISKNSSYCVKTAANRVAFITELSLSDAIHAYTAVVTVWSATR